MKLPYYLPASARKTSAPRPKLLVVTTVVALALSLGGGGLATAAMNDGDMSSLLTDFDTGEAAFSLATGLEALAANTPPTSLSTYPRAGWQATLSTRAHGVSGTVTIVDADTFRVDDFFYDGGGIQVHFILAAADDYATFRDARLVTDLNLLGTPHSGDSLTMDLPAGMTFDGLNAISLWCLPAQANFGSGTFAVPEPASAGLLALGATTLVGFARRRQMRSTH